MNLYIVYLGGQPVPGRVGEDHEVVAVVAPDVPAARKAAKAKWQRLGNAHVDAVMHLDVVDGHKVTLTEAPFVERNAMPIDPTWEP